jgi:drug/metabolite transporter (DMT)-like permease
MNETRETTRGIVAMVGACFVFMVNDTLIKVVSDHLATGQIILLRGLIASAGIVLFAWITGAFRQIRSAFSWPMLLRAIGESVGALLYLIALFNMPIANVSSIFQAVPLVITAVGALFLGARVGWRRWTAVAVGFVGVMIVVRPGPDGFNIYALSVLASVFVLVARDLATRRIAETVPLALVTAAGTVVVTMGGAAMLPFETWRPVSLGDVGLLALAAVFLVTGYALIVVATWRANVAAVAPFRYSSIPFAIVAGYLVWSDVPDPVTLFGMAVIIASGVYSFYRERKRGTDFVSRTAEPIR